MSTLGLERYADRCEHGCHITQHPAFCECSEMTSWAVFTRALETAAKRSRDGLVHQGEVRPLIRNRIAPKTIGRLYSRARREGLLKQVGKEPSTDERGRNTHHDSPIYRLRGAA